MGKEQAIVVYSHSDFDCDVSALQQNRKYVLFLKRHENGFVDTNYGRGQWTIVEDNGKKRIKSWRMYKPTDKGLDYAEFIAKLKDAVKKTKPTSTNK